MPTVKLNKRVFEKLVGKKLPLDKLKDRISMLGTDLEEIQGNEITVEVFPNRPDMLSEQGFARAFSSFIGVKTGLGKYNIKKSGQKVKIEPSVKVIRPYTVCAIVKNLKFDDEKIREIIQIQEKLHISYCRNRKKGAIGIYPMEKIKFPITYKAEDPKKIKFRPLEYPQEITGLQILQKHPAGRDYAYLLEGKNKFPIFIDANNNILSMPPIINSHETGKINEKTKEVFIECSGFDLEILQKLLNIIVTAMADMGGQIYSMDLMYGNKKIITPNLTPEKMKINPKYINKILGLNLKENEIKKYLSRMGLNYNKGDIEIPAYRTDILHPMDLVEEVAIAYGYENFKEEIPNVATTGEEDQEYKFKDNISNILSASGLIEVNTYHLTNEEIECKNMNLKEKLIEVQDSKTEEYNTLRKSILPSLMKVIQDNRHNEYPQEIFEIAEVFEIDNKKETGVKESLKLGILLCRQETDYTLIKQKLDYLLRMLDLKYEIEETDHKSFILGRTGKIKIKGKDFGVIGEIHPKILENWGIDMPLSALELNISKLFKLK